MAVTISDELEEVLTSIYDETSAMMSRQLHLLNRIDEGHDVDARLFQQWMLKDLSNLTLMIQKLTTAFIGGDLSIKWRKETELREIARTTRLPPERLFR